MGVSAPHCRRAGNGLLRNDPRTGAQRRQTSPSSCPHAYGDEDQRFTHVVNASDVEALCTVRRAAARTTFWKKMSFIHIDSNMVPYISPEEYESYHERVRQVRDGRRWSTTDALETALHLFGQVRRQPHGGGGALRRGRRAGGQGPRRAVRRDPRPRLAHLLRRHRRQTRLREAAGRAHARHGVRPLAARTSTRRSTPSSGPACTPPTA